MDNNNIELITTLENPMAFFELNGEPVALDLTNNTLHPVDADGMVYAHGSEANFEVDHDWYNEMTRYVFDDFTIHYSNGFLEVTDN